MLIAVLSLSLLAGASGLLLGFAAVRFAVEGDPLLEKIEALLPQSQCGQCGYAGCRPYAEAIAAGTAPINLCPPGGKNGVVALADLLGQDPDAFTAAALDKSKTLAVIDESQCIGCTLCIQACPVDAILGAAKHMHTVLASECTGCELCVAPCPVDCIRMMPIVQTISTWKWHAPTTSVSA